MTLAFYEHILVIVVIQRYLPSTAVILETFLCSRFVSKGRTGRFTGTLYSAFCRVTSLHIIRYVSCTIPRVIFEQWETHWCSPVIKKQGCHCDECHCGCRHGTYHRERYIITRIDNLRKNWFQFHYIHTIYHINWHMVCCVSFCGGYVMSSLWVYMSYLPMCCFCCCCCCFFQAFPADAGLQHDDVIRGKHFPHYWPLVGNSPITGEFPPNWPAMRSFEVFSDLRLNKRLSKQSRRRLCETPLLSLWRHGNE